MKNGGRISWNATATCEIFKTDCLLGRHHTNVVLVNLSKDRSLRLVILVENHSISPRDQSRIHQFGKKVLPGIFLGCVLYAGGIWKGDTQVADLEELEKMDASGVHAKRLNAKEVILPKGGEEFIFLVADGTVKPLGKIRHWKSPPWFGIIQSEETVIMTFYRRIRRVSACTTFSRLISGCRRSTKWFLVHLWTRHIPPSRWTKSQTLHAARGIISYSTENYIDVTRATHTALDVLQESRIDDCWNIDGSRDLSDSWTGFTHFPLLKEKPPDGYMWSGWEIDQTASNIKAWFNCGQKIWRSKSRNSKMKEKQNWASEKPELENARTLRGIYFIEPEDEEFKEILENARRKLEVLAAPAVPCKSVKSRKYGATRSKNDDHKSKLTCILEAEESKRLRMEGTAPRIHEDHIAGRGSHSLQHFNLGHKLTPMPQAMKILEAKAAVEK